METYCIWGSNLVRKMVEKIKIILDTNFLLTTIRYKLHGLEEIKNKIPAEFYVLSGTIDEMTNLSKKDKKIRNEYNLVKKMLENEKVEGIKSTTENVDEDLIKFSKSYVIATNDKQLRQKIKENGGKSIFIKKLTTIDLDEIL